MNQQTAQDKNSSRKQVQQLQTQTLPQVTSPTASKKSYELIWKIIFIAVTLVSSFLMQKIYRFQTQQEYSQIRKGSIYDFILYSLPFGFVFGYLDIKIHDYLDPIIDKYYINHTKYSDVKKREKRCFTLAKWSFSIGYYIIASVAGYIVLQKTTVLPIWLGGNGDFMNLYKVAPHIYQQTQMMKLYYLLQFGKHFSRAFSHIFIRPQGNFYQYALHHGLSTFLILFSYLSNMWLVGVFVLFLHDVSDLFLCAGRLYMQYRYKNATIFHILSGIALLTWVFTRNFLLSYCCIYPSIHASLYIVPVNFIGNLQILAFPGHFMTIMLIILQVLQIFWTYYIVSSSISVLISQKIAKHTYD